MSVINPSTELYLIKCPIEADNMNQITFSSQSAQLAYFRSLPNKHVDNYTFQRKDGTIRFEVNHEELLEYNYVMYKNDAYENKWIFAFVRNATWKNNQLVELAIETDPWQTWQFDITFKRSLVEREHVNNDTVGEHTYPENLEYGNYVCGAYQAIDYSAGYMICLQVTDILDSNISTDKLYNNVYQGCYIIATDYNRSGAGAMNSILGMYNSAGKIDAVVSIFVVPYSISTWKGATFQSGGGSVSVFVPEDSTTYSTLTSPVAFTDTVNTLDGYTPKNNKLLSAPFNYFTLSNSSGDVVDYRFEDFEPNVYYPNDNIPRFAVIGALTEGGQIKCYPVNYKLGTENSKSLWDYGINGYQYPTLSWTSDYYLNWRARNSQYIDYQNRMFGLKVGGQFISSVASGGELGGDWLGESLDYVASKWQQQHVAEITPPSAKGNVNCGDLGFAFDMADKFILKQMTIRNEYARKIDDFFSMYGYKIMRCKVPNITGRQNWNYVKTIGCNITGDIPTSDMANLKAMFNRGVTLWHNTATFMDYSQDNSII